MASTRAKPGDGGAGRISGLDVLHGVVEEGRNRLVFIGPVLERDPVGWQKCGDGHPPLAHELSPGLRPASSATAQPL